MTPLCDKLWWVILSMHSQWEINDVIIIGYIGRQHDNFEVALYTLAQDHVSYIVKNIKELHNHNTNIECHKRELLQQAWE